MSKHTVTHASWSKKSKIQCYDSYLEKDIADGKLDSSYSIYKGSTGKKNSKSIFGPITF